MAKEANQKKIGPLRRAFNYAGAAFLSVYFGGPLISAHIGDITDDLSQKLDVPVETIHAMTRGRTYILHPDSDSARAFAYLNDSPDLRAALMEQSAAPARQSDYYDFMGLSYAHPLFGQTGFLNTVTLGQSGKLSACYVFFPSERLSLDDYFEGMSDIPLKDLANRPGTRADYLKLILFHELEHCNQPATMSDELREFMADQVAYDTYLKLGGNRDVVRAVLSLRTVQTLSNIIFKGGAGDGVQTQHTSTALLHPRYFGGTAIPQKEFKAVQDEAFLILQHEAVARKMGTFELLNIIQLYRVTHNVLNDPAQDMSPHTRALLQQFNDAYEFLTVKPEQKIAHLKTASGPAVH